MELIKLREELFDEYYEACKESYENNITEWMSFELDCFKQCKRHILQAYDNYETGTDSFINYGCGSGVFFLINK